MLDMKEIYVQPAESVSCGVCCCYWLWMKPNFKNSMIFADKIFPLSGSLVFN